MAGGTLTSSPFHLFTSSSLHLFTSSPLHPPLPLHPFGFWLARELIRARMTKELNDPD
jgi:hypothetical protein